MSTVRGTSRVGSPGTRPGDGSHACTVTVLAGAPLPPRCSRHRRGRRHGMLAGALATSQGPRRRGCLREPKRRCRAAPWPWHWKIRPRARARARAHAQAQRQVLPSVYRRRSGRWRGRWCWCGRTRGLERGCWRRCGFLTRVGSVRLGCRLPSLELVTTIHLRHQVASCGAASCWRVDEVYTLAAGLRHSSWAHRAATLAATRSLKPAPRGGEKQKKREKRKGGVRENSLLVSGPLSTRRTIPRPDSDGGPISYLYGIRVEQGSREEQSCM